MAEGSTRTRGRWWAVAREARAVQTAPLAVSDALIGLPLATPRQRALSMLVDVGVVGLLSHASGYWLALALLVMGWFLRDTLAAEGARLAAQRVVAVVLVAAAATVAWSEWRKPPPLPEVEEAADAAVGDKKRRAHTGPEQGEAAGGAEHAARLQAEIDRLRAEADRPRRFSERLDELLDGVGASFGWGFVYFTLLPAWWRGQTLGKRLFGLRVLELTGKPVTPLLALKRYGAYTAGMATGGLGFLQLLWEPNRQALHDKAAHTVVVQERREAPAAVGEPPPPPSAPPPSA